MTAARRVVAVVVAIAAVGSWGSAAQGGVTQPPGSAFVYWTNTQSGTIGRGTIDGNPANVNQSFIAGASTPAGVTVDGQHIYWTNRSAGTIGRANLDGSDVEQSFITGAQHPVGIAVYDQHIYWANSDTGADNPDSTIGRANLDGSDVQQSFISAGQLGLMGLAVDDRHIYWTDHQAGTIGRANSDGSDVVNDFISVDSPTGIAVDSQHVYWANSATNTIGDANLDGSDVDESLVTGASGEQLAVDFQHVYWANSATNTIGDADLDGRNVNQSFITGAHTPVGVALGQPQPECIRQGRPPLPPPGGAVFARPLDPDSQNANAVVLAASSSWNGAASCAGTSQGAADVMSHPTSIAVAPGGAVSLRDATAGLTSLWGAKDVRAGDQPPTLFPGRPDWTTTAATVTGPDSFLHDFNSCRACSLPTVSFTPTLHPLSAAVAYQNDLSGANLSDANLSGANLTGWSLSGANLSDANLSGTNLTGWNLSGVNLSGANLTGTLLDHTVVDRAEFDGSDLRGAQLVALRYSAPPSFSGVRVGPFNGSCTMFQDTDLVNGSLTPLKPDAGCETSPLLPGSTVPLTLLFLLAHTDNANVDFKGAEFVADAGDRAVLAGVNLSGTNLAGASFVGFPADFEGTDFDGASLHKTSFQLADLSGATFKNVSGNGASFQGASLAAQGGVKGASFAGPDTTLQQADFVDADVSGATFQSADLTGAVFSGALAVNTDFNSVIAKGTVFSGAHIYGDGDAFESARDLTGADFSNAVLAGAVDQSGGFNLTGADLTGAKFDRAQCIACNFTGATLSKAVFSGAYLPGAVLSSATLNGANLDGAWLYCGDLTNDSCAMDPSSQSQWDWPLALGSGELYGPVPFSTTDLTGVSLDDVTTCPDGSDQFTSPDCQGHLLPSGTLTIPVPCSAAALGACPTRTSTLFDATSIGSPVAVVPATPLTWATTLPTGRGYYVGLDDGTVRLKGNGSAQVVAGTHGAHCPSPTDACGDGGPATQALLGVPAGLAVGLDGSLYIADPILHRVRRIDPSGIITTVAGTGEDCGALPTSTCGDGGPATSAALSGPYGVWISPSGDLFIADGRRGIREVLPDGDITTVGGGFGAYDVRSVVGDGTGSLYATTNDPDYLIKVDPTGRQVTPVVGTGTSGYNGNTDSLSGLLLPGTQVQLNHPEGLSVALNGDVLFADTNNNLIRAYVPTSGHVIDDLGGLVSGGTPQGGFNGDNQWADQTKLARPEDVTATRGGLFVVADTANHRIRQLGPSPPTEQLRGGAPGKSLGAAPTAAASSRLSWRRCAAGSDAARVGFVCATFRVPLDYRHPDGRQITLAVVKHPATRPRQRIGTLFVNPGGTGGEGTVQIPDWFLYLPRTLRERFDVVSWDPRGIGQSTAVQCFSTQAAEAEFLRGAAVFPSDAARQRTYIARWAKLGRRCEARDPALLRHVSTADSARDLDRLRQAVGARQLTYLGLSYGTLLGATYANLFPARVRALALDGNLAPSNWTAGGTRSPSLSTSLRIGSDVGAGRDLAAFLYYCGRARIADCRFSAGSPRTTRAKFATLLARLRRAPTMLGTHVITYAYLLGVIDDGLDIVQPHKDPRLPESAAITGWPGIASVLQRAWKARGTLAASAARSEPADSRYEGPEQALSVICGDSFNPREPQRYVDLVPFVLHRAGAIGLPSLWADEPCATWPVRAVDTYDGPWNRPTANPILVIGNTADPSTPYTNAVEMARELRNARLLTVTGYGHTALLNPSACANRYIAAYLERRSLPAVDTVCRQDRLPFAKRRKPANDVRAFGVRSPERGAPIPTRAAAGSRSPAPGRRTEPGRDRHGSIRLP